MAARKLRCLAFLQMKHRGDQALLKVSIALPTTSTNGDFGSLSADSRLTGLSNKAVMTFSVSPQGCGPTSNSWHFRQKDMNNESAEGSLVG